MPPSVRIILQAVQSTLAAYGRPKSKIAHEREDVGDEVRYSRLCGYLSVVPERLLLTHSGGPGVAALDVFALQIRLM